MQNENALPESSSPLGAHLTDQVIFCMNMRSRKRPFVTVDDGHRVAIVCHLANMSMDLKRAVHWDPVKEQVIGDKGAQAACVRPYRAPWDSVLRSLVKV